MKKGKEKQIKIESNAPKLTESPKKGTPPPAFQKPPMKSAISPGFKIRQNQRNQFFSRTRRGGI